MKRVSKKLSDISTTVSSVSEAFEAIQQYSYQYIVGFSQVNETEFSEDAANLIYVSNSFRVWALMIYLKKISTLRSR